MAAIPEYKINGKNLTEILQDSDSRESINILKYRKNSSYIALAKYDSAVHKFNYDSNIQNILKTPESSEINLGAISKGFAPLLNHRISAGTSATITIYYKGTGSPYTNGQLYVKDSNGNYYNGYTQSSPASVPTVIILAIQGAGGGGACGGGYYTGYTSYGGGCGPLYFLELELPYASTSWAEILKIEMGSGGSGGTTSSTSGGNGSDTVVKLRKLRYENLTRASMYEHKEVLRLYGGAGGSRTDYYADDYIPGASIQQSITTVKETFTINNDAGWGRVANAAGENIYVGGNNAMYLPGNYYSKNAHGFYKQANTTSPRITSATSGSLKYIYGKDWNYETGRFGLNAVWANNRVYGGIASRFGTAGAIGPNYGDTGGAGTHGSGGAGGSPNKAPIGTGGIGSGGRGGNALVNIYW